MAGSHPSFAAVLVAAGRGRRMGGPVPKAWLPLLGIPLVLRSASRLHKLPGHLATVLVIHPEDRAAHVAPLLAELHAAGVAEIVDGGETRQESVLAGLRATRSDAQVVLVHDAVRPFFPPAAVVDAIALAAGHRGAILAQEARDTLKQVDAGGKVLRTVPRETIWQAQTPQAFPRARLLADLTRAHEEGFVGTDEASIVEHFGGTVQVVRGGAFNLKITTPEDLVLAAEIARHEERG